MKRIKRGEHKNKMNKNMWYWSGREAETKAWGTQKVRSNFWQLQSEQSEHISSAKIFQHVLMKRGRIFSLHCHSWPRASDWRGGLKQSTQSVESCEERARSNPMRGMQRDVGGKRPEDWTACTDCELNYSFCIFTRVWPVCEVQETFSFFFYR